MSIEIIEAVPVTFAHSAPVKFMSGDTVRFRQPDLSNDMEVLQHRVEAILKHEQNRRGRRVKATVTTQLEYEDPTHGFESGGVYLVARIHIET